MEKHELTQEQDVIVNTVVNKKFNVVIQSLAGCGKSNSLLAISKHFVEKYSCTDRNLLIYILFYNHSLHQEGIKRIQALGLERYVRCHTYHSLTLELFLDRTARTDFGDSLIHDALRTTQVKPECETQMKNLRVLMLDEAQDMTDSLADLVKHILSFANKPQLVLCGDAFQKIYGFRNTTLEYMINPSKHFGHLVASDGKFENARLSTCFRITSKMAKFLNTYMHPQNLEAFVSREFWAQNSKLLLFWFGDGIRAFPRKPENEEDDITYIKFNWNFKSLAKEVNRWYQKYSPEDTALLCRSGQSNKSLVYKLINALTDVAKPEEVNWHTCFGKEASQIQSQKGKRIASTIHRFKGLERKLIVTFGIDAFAEKVVQDPFELYCLVYVALTRAQEKLIVIQCDKQPYAPIRAALACPGIPCLYMEEETKKKKKKKEKEVKKEIKEVTVDQRALRIVNRFVGSAVSVNELFDFVRYDEWLDRHSYATPEVYRGVANDLFTNQDAALVNSLTSDTQENVLPLYSLAIQLATQLYFSKTLPTFSDLYQLDQKDDLLEVTQFLRTLNVESVIDGKQFNWPVLVQVANAFQTMQSGFLCKWRQIQKYEDWVPSAKLQECFNFVLKAIQVIMNEPEKVEIKFYTQVHFPVYMKNLQLDLTGKVFMETENAFVYLSFEPKESQYCAALICSSMYHLNPKHACIAKPTYFILVNQGTMVEVIPAEEETLERQTFIIGPNIDKFLEKFFTQAIARKFDVPLSFIELAAERCGVRTRKLINVRGRGRGRSRRQVKSQNETVNSFMDLQTFFFKQSKKKRPRIEDLEVFRFQPSTVGLT